MFWDFYNYKLPSLLILSVPPGTGEKKGGTDSPTCSAWSVTCAPTTHTTSSWLRSSCTSSPSARYWRSWRPTRFRGPSLSGMCFLPRRDVRDWPFCAPKLADFLTRYLPNFLRVSSQILHCTRQGFLRSRSVFFSSTNKRVYCVRFSVSCSCHFSLPI